MDHQFSRRHVLRTAAGIVAAATTTLSGCGGDTAGGATRTLQMTWWGSTDRHKRTQQALAAFRQRHAKIQVNSQFSGWDGYWEKLATQTAGGNAPDVIQMDYAYITQYARRSSLRALDDLVPGIIDLKDFTRGVLVGGKIDNKLYGVTAGINSTALVYNATMLRRFGLEMPDHTMTWNGLAEFCGEIAARAPKGVVPLENAISDAQALEIWLRQRNKALFTAEGALGFDPSDLSAWFGYWDELRRLGRTAPPQLQATAAGDIQNSLLTRRKAAIDFAHSNQLTAYAAVLKDDVALHMYPQGGPGAKPGQFLKPAMFLSISAKSRYPQEAATLVDALLTEPDIAAILGTDRGIPPSTAIRASLKPNASKVEQKTYDYIEFVTGKVGPLPPPQPLGAGEINGKTLQFAADQVSFEKMTIDAAVARFFEDAQRVLK